MPLPEPAPGLPNLPPALTYQGEVIHERGEMLSLTDMWTAARRKHVDDGGDPGAFEGRRPDDWKKDAANRAFLDQVARSLNARPEGIWLGKRGAGGGTYAHWQVGFAFAKWLSPEFHMWCNTVVRDHMETRATFVPESVVRLSPTRDAAIEFKAFFSVGRLIGLDRNQSALAANRATRKTTGLDILAAMETPHLRAPQQEMILTPSDIGGDFDGKSAMAINSLLAVYGFQIGKRDAKDRPYWVPTDAGEPFAVWLDTGKRHGDGTPVRQLKWSAGIVDALRVAIAERPG